MGCGVVSGAPCFWGCWLIYRCWGINALRISISSVQSLLSRLIKSIHSLCLPVLNKVTGFTAHFTQRPIAQVSDQRTTFSSVTFASHSLQLLLIFLLSQHQHTGPVVDFLYLKLTVFIDSDNLLQTSRPLTHEPVRSDDEFIHSLTRIWYQQWFYTAHCDCFSRWGRKLDWYNTNAI